jgi:hypothetical protein
MERDRLLWRRSPTRRDGLLPGDGAGPATEGRRDHLFMSGAAKRPMLSLVQSCQQCPKADERDALVPPEPPSTSRRYRWVASAVCR